MLNDGDKNERGKKREEKVREGDSGAHSFRSHTHTSGFTMTELERAKTREKSTIHITTDVVILLRNAIQDVTWFGVVTLAPPLGRKVEFLPMFNQNLTAGV